MKLTPLHNQLLLLAPSTGGVPEAFLNPSFDPGQHTQMLAKAQKLRGRIYVEDGAIEPHELTPEGRHYIASDEESWPMPATRSRWAI